MEDDAYSVFLAQASRAARLEADPAAEEYVDPIQSVATFTGRVAQLLGDFAEDEVYEAAEAEAQQAVEQAEEAASVVESSLQVVKDVAPRVASAAAASKQKPRAPPRPSV